MTDDDDRGRPAMLPGTERGPSPIVLRGSAGIPLRVAASGTGSGTGSGPASVPIAASFYDKIGGRPTFERLVRHFYSGVASDPALLALYPEEDLEPAIQRLTGFLEQYWGGPGTYSEERGHPRLRMRHMPFKVNPDARDRWLTHMRSAVDSLDLPADDHELLWSYLERAAFAMVNTFDE